MTYIRRTVTYQKFIQDSKSSNREERLLTKEKTRLQKGKLH